MSILILFGFIIVLVISLAIYKILKLFHLTSLFTDRKLRANAIVSYMNKETGAPSFTKYKENVSDSDVVEYMTAMDLKKKNMLDTPHLLNAL